MIGRLFDPCRKATEYKQTNQAVTKPQYYCLTGPGTFNPATQQPCQLPPPPPGFIPLFANPIQNQTWLQPLNTEGYLIGDFNFVGATIEGYFSWPYYNDTVTGTTCNELTKLNTVGYAVVTSGSEPAQQVLGIAASGCGTAGVSDIAMNGQIQVLFDSSAVTVGDAVGVSASAGLATDVGSPASASGTIGKIIPSPSGLTLGPVQPSSCNTSPGCWIQLNLGSGGGAGVRVARLQA